MAFAADFDNLVAVSKFGAYMRHITEIPQDWDEFLGVDGIHFSVLEIYEAHSS